MATKKRQRDGQKRQRFGKAPPPALRFCLFVDKDGQPPVFVTENRQKLNRFQKTSYCTKQPPGTVHSAQSRAATFICFIASRPGPAGPLSPFRRLVF